jgi:threonylcarbamoyladenosine tRNA methylthiotransferase MtaB
MPDAWTHRSERPGWVTLMPGLERKARAFVKVQDGCNSHCTYCIVPAARGPQRSRSIRAIVDEVNLLYRLGYREAVLSGVQIGAYGRDWDRETRRVRRDGGPTLTELVERLLVETPMPRIRISSIQPQDWPDGFLELFSDPRMCRHLHLPLQSGSDAVLKRMVRRYRAADFRALVERVRSAMPEVAITADVMVGFPGETEAEHAESLTLIRQLAFAEQHVFRYSARPGTAAARLPDDVPPPVKKRRSEEARALDAELRRAYKHQFLGRTMDVLWEEPAPAPVQESGELVWSGLTDNYLRVFARGALHEGQITPVRLDELAVDGIFGEIAQGEIAWTIASSAASSAALSPQTSSTETST